MQLWRLLISSLCNTRNLLTIYLLSDCFVTERMFIMNKLCKDCCDATISNCYHCSIGQQIILATKDNKPKANNKPKLKPVSTSLKQAR